MPTRYREGSFSFPDQIVTELMGGVSRQVAIGIVLGFGVLVGGVMGSTGRTVDQFESVAEPEAVAEGTITVHVGGWVVSPGVVEAPEGSIIAEVLVLAGGVRSGALVDQINLASPVRDGDQVIVPGPDEAAAASGDGPLSINRASVEDLQGLPGVGPVLAERIVAYRDQNGPFNQVEDLLDVSGIGEAKLASLRDLIRVP